MGIDTIMLLVVVVAGACGACVAVWRSLLRDSEMGEGVKPWEVNRGALVMTAFAVFALMSGATMATVARRKRQPARSRKSTRSFRRESVDPFTKHAA